jgi:CMP/dCMP kinase
VIRIAIDGPASSGKGTVARMVAKALGYTYIDTGSMYRAVALAAQRKGLSCYDEAGVGTLARSLAIDFAWDGETLRTRLAVGGGPKEDVTDALRSEEVGRGASDVASLPAVRTALLDQQRALGVRGGVVMDGRDIGTVVLPDAELKLFLDATAEERARRRTLELHARGDLRPFERVLEEIEARDAQDAGRTVAPLKQADDAVYLDTTGLTPERVRDRIVELAAARGAR